MLKQNFQQPFSSLQCHIVPSEIILNVYLVLKKHFLLSVLEIVVLLNIFVETDRFFQDSVNHFNSNLFEMAMFYNIIHVFTVTL